MEHTHGGGDYKKNARPMLSKTNFVPVELRLSSVLIGPENKWMHAIVAFLV